MDTRFNKAQADSFDLRDIDFIDVMNRMDEGVIITDINGIIRYYNETQAQIDGLDRQFVVGKKVTDIYMN